jgi:hypothetical protein
MWENISLNTHSFDPKSLEESLEIEVMEEMILPQE